MNLFQQGNFHSRIAVLLHEYTRYRCLQTYVFCKVILFLLSVLSKVIRRLHTTGPQTATILKVEDCHLEIIMPQKLYIIYLSDFRNLFYNSTTGVLTIRNIRNLFQRIAIMNI